MIFYFSGTGNSLAAAKKLLAEGEQLINLADCVKNKKFGWVIPEGESLGFVFPVYYGGLPSIVQQFLNHATFAGESDYVWSVITCGAEIFAAGKMLGDRLAEMGMFLDAVFPVVMPDNCVILYDLDEEDKEPEVLAAADKTLDEIKEKLAAHEVTTLCKNKKDTIFTSVMYPLYVRGRKTKKFWTNDSCVSCGACERKCPAEAIKLTCGQVTWVKDRCAHCMACMTCNAIQYGKRTIGKHRYKHPMLRKEM